MQNITNYHWKCHHRLHCYTIYPQFIHNVSIEQSTMSLRAKEMNGRLKSDKITKSQINDIWIFHENEKIHWDENQSTSLSCEFYSLITGYFTVRYIGFTARRRKKKYERSALKLLKHKKCFLTWLREFEVYSLQIENSERCMVYWCMPLYSFKIYNVKQFHLTKSIRKLLVNIKFIFVPFDFGSPFKFN